MTARAHLAALATGVLAAALAAEGSATAQTLATDLADHEIEITSSFTGSDVLVFGATDLDLAQEQGHVIIVLRGPPADTVVRRKERLLGIWVNRSSIEFASVPQFYAIATTAPLRELMPFRMIERLKLGLEEIVRDPLRTGPADPVERDQFADALVRRKKATDLYQNHPRGVVAVRGGLFRTTFTLPSTVPTGRYGVDVYLVRDGTLVGFNNTSFFISKIGIERNLYRLAIQQPELYGLLAIMVAVFAGWIAAVVFRRP